jgi:hypothetical protein
MKTIGILQPGYLPWLGFLDQVDQSDVFVLYDDVQYDKHSWRNRNRIKTKQGMCWLTVPVLTKGKESQLIKDTEVNNTESWVKKHVSTIRQSYSKSKYFCIAERVCERLELRTWKTLCELNTSLLEIIFEELGLTKKFIVCSSHFNFSGDRNSRLVNMIKYFGGDTFIEGRAGRAYIDLPLFKANGIQVMFQEYKHPVYDQTHGEFIPYLSILDLLCNCGPRSLEIVRSGRNNCE